MLATLTVTNSNDAIVTGAGSAPGTLRQAIYDANGTSESDVIQFAPGLMGNINLSVSNDSAFGGSALLITSAITIRGNTNGITIHRDVSAAEMRLFRVTSAGALTLDSMTLSGGIARGITGTTPGENGGDATGGAVLNQGKVQLVSSTIYANQAIGGNAGAGARAGAGLGGALFNDGGTLEISNATLSGNSVYAGTGATVPGSFGGAIYTKNGSLTLHNSTITNSTATTGRGIYMFSVDGTATADIRSSIIGQSDLHLMIREFLPAFGENGHLVVTGANNLIRSQGDYDVITISIEDPLLGPLANNGGPTFTHALLANSPAINIGSNSQSLATDQRGASFARVVGSNSDIGAFEVQTTTGPALPGDYNSNQVVDAADYVLWRKTRGNVVPQYSGADGSGNSVVDDDDYGVWRTHFGGTPTGAASGSLSTSAALMKVAAAAQSSTPIVAYIDGPISAVDNPTNATDRGKHTAGLSASPHPQSRYNLELIALASMRSSELDRSESVSMHPHLHVAAVDAENKCVERMLDDIWAAWPSYVKFSV